VGGLGKYVTCRISEFLFFYVMMYYSRQRVVYTTACILHQSSGLAAAIPAYLDDDINLVSDSGSAADWT